MNHRLTTLAASLLALAAWPSLAQEPAPRATVALVGDTDRFNIGQDGYCGKRTEIESPAGKHFRVPAGQRTYFYLRSRLRGANVTLTCEGDFSFTPQAGLLHIIRYTMVNEQQCLLEMFRGAPGETPTPMPVTPEGTRTCLAQ